MPQNYKFFLIKHFATFVGYEKSPTFVGLTNMEEQMEYLVHYVWQHRIYGTAPLLTNDGLSVEVIDPGVHNLCQSGPDFFNAKVKIGGLLWIGNVEVHERSSDWYRHHHETDAAYNNVILHVVTTIDDTVYTADGKCLPQLALAVPIRLQQNYQALIDEETYPPCYRIIPQVPDLTVHAWMSRLTVERLEEKTERVQQYLKRVDDDWERAFFITLARNFGFGTNAQAFEQWAFTIHPQQIGKHRDDVFQVEAFFMGQAGLLNDKLVKPKRRDSYYMRLKAEYTFLQHKFNLQPIDPVVWKFGRLRPQNFPYVRLSQLSRLYAERRANLSRLLEAQTLDDLRNLFRIGVTDYWRTHYAFGEESKESDKVLQSGSLNLLIINTASPLFFACGRQRLDEDLAERAFNLLEQLPAERNYITRCWERAGLNIEHAADSQALIQLRRNYCERKDCLRCRFGSEYLRGHFGE